MHAFTASLCSYSLENGIEQCHHQHESREEEVRDDRELAAVLRYGHEIWENLVMEDALSASLRSFAKTKVDIGKL